MVYKPIYSRNICSGNDVVKTNIEQQSCFIVSDGQGQLTVLGANDLTWLESDIIVNDSNIFSKTIEYAT